MLYAVKFVLLYLSFAFSLAIESDAIDEEMERLTAGKRKLLSAEKNPPKSENNEPKFRALRL